MPGELSDKFQPGFVARSKRRASHAGIVRLLDWGEGEVYFLVMELLEDTRCAREIDPRGMPFAARCE